MTRFWMQIRKWNIAKKFQLVTFSITISGTLLALDHFSAQSSLSIRIRRLHIDYSMDATKSFYETNDLRIPTPLRPLFTLQHREAENYTTIDGGMSDVEIIEMLRNNRDKGDSAWVSMRTEKLEKQIGVYHHDRRFFIWSDQYTGEDQFRKILEIAKATSISYFEYYVFLCAAINTREILQNVLISNTGDLELRDLKIVIPSPVSEIVKSRHDNILNYEFVGFNLHEIKDDPNSVIITTPSLKKGKSISLRMSTKENELDKREFLYSFKEHHTVDKFRFLWTTLTIFALVTLLTVFFHGKKQDSGTLEKEADEA